jgi:hypothetical protein
MYFLRKLVHYIMLPFFACLRPSRLLCLSIDGFLLQAEEGNIGEQSAVFVVNLSVHCHSYCMKV